MRRMTPEEALEYHSRGRKGKIEVVPTKPCRTQEDLSLAYSPGVAEPCLEIAKDPEQGLRVHGQGQPRRRHLQRHGGARPRQHRAARGEARHGGQGRPLQALRRHRRLRHRGGRDTIRRRSSRRSRGSRRPSAASTSRTSSRPSASRSRRQLKKRLKIPVFHDDQHGTAIISAAALLNALEVVGKKIDEVKVVFVRRGRVGDRLREALPRLRRRGPRTCGMVDKSGVIYRGPRRRT